MDEGFARILVPYDGSKYSKKAIDVAIKIARKFDSELYLLTAVERLLPSPSSNIMDYVDTKKLQKYLKASMSKIDLILRDEMLRCRENGVMTDYEIIEGSPTKTILSFAKKRKIDLIVIGSAGLAGIQKIMALGSVSRKVSELASCPVLIVR
ncbi:MAG TPA: universal stress protein [Candidatus Nitrosotenuis sp.]|nr:universal stress protein [Candidatus Nitrosotenuis sp.]